MKSVLIVDSHPIVRHSLICILQQESMNVIDESAYNGDVLDCLKSKHVDLLLIDTTTSLFNGLELVKKIRRSDFSTKIILLGYQTSNLLVNHALNIGANGFVNLRDDVAQIVNAINAVMSDYIYFPFTKKDNNFSHFNNDRDGLLSIRETQILEQLVMGKKGVDIADDLNISFKTVSTYKYRIMKKLNVNTMIDLLTYAKEIDI